jgi:hypothetical protein
MPNNADFSKVENIHEMEVNPEGWTRIIIEYGITNDALPLYYWRIKDTTHTFTIPVIRMDFISAGNYKKHFEDALRNFREDYKLWEKEGFVTEWSKEYRTQYSRFIC